MFPDFEWDDKKNEDNQAKHGVSFEEAQRAFQDPHRLIIRDAQHSIDEERWYCIGDTETGVVTARFTVGGARIRIYGAGHWRKMRKRYYRQQGYICSS